MRERAAAWLPGDLVKRRGERRDQLTADLAPPPRPFGHDRLVANRGSRWARLRPGPIPARPLPRPHPHPHIPSSPTVALGALAALRLNHDASTRQLRHTTRPPRSPPLPL